MKNKKPKLGEIFSISMLVAPCIIMSSIGEYLTTSSFMQIAYAGAFGLLGGALGGLAYYISLNKSNLIKGLSLLVSLAICASVLYVVSQNPSDEVLVEKDWVTQQIGELEFDTPQELSLIQSEIPESYTWLYTDFELYASKQSGRRTYFTKGTLTVDSVSLEQSFSRNMRLIFELSDMEIENVDIQEKDSDDEVISCIFTLNVDNEKLFGYGYVFLFEKKLESLWLMPIKKGFSRKYIEEFDSGIY